jgi:hypothetical protein
MIPARESDEESENYQEENERESRIRPVRDHSQKRSEENECDETDHRCRHTRYRGLDQNDENEVVETMGNIMVLFHIQQENDTGECDCGTYEDEEERERSTQKGRITGSISVLTIYHSASKRTRTRMYRRCSRMQGIV